MKVETYCTGKKKKSEREDGGKTYGEKRETERERESYFGCKTPDELF
jgi:hypothetical protein